MRLSEAVQERLWVLAGTLEPQWDYFMGHTLARLILTARRKPWRAAGHLLWLYDDEPWVLDERGYRCKNRDIERRLLKAGEMVNRLTGPDYAPERLRAMARLAVCRRHTRQLAPLLGLRPGSPDQQALRERQLPAEVVQWLTAPPPWESWECAALDDEFARFDDEYDEGWDEIEPMEKLI